MSTQKFMIILWIVSFVCGLAISVQNPVLDKKPANVEQQEVTEDQARADCYESMAKKIWLFA